MTEIRVPEELQPILRDFTKAVLRERPEDVLLFSRDYFLAKWSEQRMATYTLEPSVSAAFAELPEPLKQAVEVLFKRFDADCDGNLSISELYEMVGTAPGAFGIDSQSIDTSSLMASLDVDNSTSVAWQEWSDAAALWLRDLGF